MELKIQIMKQHKQKPPLILLPLTSKISFLAKNNNNETINKALKSKALQNPIFAPYKKVLEYARFIINGNNIEEKNDGKQETFGFIINVAELFEIYITKLLQKEFSDIYFK